MQLKTYGLQSGRIKLSAVGVSVRRSLMNLLRLANTKRWQLVWMSLPKMVEVAQIFLGEKK